MPRSLRAALLSAAVVWSGACAQRRGASDPLEPLPPPPPRAGDLAIRVVHPPVTHAPLGVARPGEWLTVRADSTYRIQARDSAFIFGTVGRGDATLAIDGRPIAVFPTGGWIAWLPLPADTLARFELVATAQGDTARMTLVSAIASRFVPPDSGPWLDTTSFAPAGDRWVRPNEGVALGVRAAPGATLRLLTPEDTVALSPDSTPAALSWGRRAFDRLAADGARPPIDRYVGWWSGPLGPDPGPVLAPLTRPDPGDSAWARLEVVRGTDTLRAVWPLRLGVVDPANPLIAVVNDDTADVGSDSILAGRPSPNGTYHWFFPTGTRAVTSGRADGQVRLQLSRRSVAWVDATDVQPLHPGTPPPSGVARSLRLTPGPASVELRVPLPARIAYRVDESERAIRLTLYGVAADVDWIQYGGTDPLVRRIEYAQPTEDETIVTVHLTTGVWGYRTRWAGHDLLLEIRRPPAVDRRRVLRGRRVVLDPGHPPGGATGPTGVREADVVLGVARKAAQLLRQRDAEVRLTRDADSSIGLVERLRMAEEVDAEVLISVHANALPDGVNPFVNHGTSVYYFHPRSAPLARAMNRALVRQFGFRDLGMGRGDLALARPTWMPAVLLEGLFMMIPEQEAVLGSEAGQWRYARGIVEGLETFLRGWAEQ